LIKSAAISPISFEGKLNGEGFPPAKDIMSGTDKSANILRISLPSTPSNRQEKDLSILGTSLLKIFSCPKDNNAAIRLSPAKAVRIADGFIILLSL
jgi:hypothetical protein